MKICVSLSTAILTGLAGCAALRGGHTVADWKGAGEAPIARPSSAEGSYALYAVDNRTPIITVHLEKGELVGFVKEPAGGEVIAVGGYSKVRLRSTGSYYWKRL